MRGKFADFSFCVLLAIPLFGNAQSTSAPLQNTVPASPESTIRATADLVVVDVTVNDSHQNPVRGLGASDFAVLEDGQPQTIKSFEEHAPSPQANIGPLPKLEPGMFTNYSPAPESAALNILLFDKLNTPMNAQVDVRNQVMKYLKEQPRDARVAIFSLSSELRLLQGFTSDPELLRAVVAGKKGNGAASPLMDHGVAGDIPGTGETLAEAVAATGSSMRIGNSPALPDVVDSMKIFEAEIGSVKLQMRARYTLDALNQLARYLSNLPGRKNLLWFSGSFPISILPDPELKYPFIAVASAEGEYRETVNMLARSQVAVYPIDARGVMTEPVFDARDTGHTKSGGTPFGGAAEFGRKTAKFDDQTASERITMTQMATATGGKEFENINDLKAAITKAIDAGSNYYTLAYRPNDRDWNGKFRKIEVTLNRRGARLAYRRGYYADDPKSNKAKSEVPNSDATGQQPSSVRAAMLHAAPEPTQIIFTADVRPAGDKAEDAIATGNQAGEKVTGPFRRYTVHFFIDPKQLECGADGAEHRCILEFRTYVYGAGGALLNIQGNRIQVDFPAVHVADALQRNIEYKQQISVPAGSDCFLRIGVRDTATDQVGALELPVSAAAKLPPR